jgi:F-type H+-transporting ATPase subunit c
MRNLRFALMVLAVLFCAVPVFAADGGSTVMDLAPIGIGLGMGLAAGLCGVGEGRAVASATESVARNPGATSKIQLLLILGLAFIESLTLFTFATIFIKIK